MHADTRTIPKKCEAVFGQEWRQKQGGKSSDQMAPCFIDDFPLSRKKFLRYGLWQRQIQNCLGTIIIFNDYGQPFEAAASLAVPLTERGFHVATFDWFPHHQSENFQNHIHSSLPEPISDFRLNTQNMKEIFSQIFLPRLPAPFYSIGIGAGALFALAAHHVLQSQIRRMLLISPSLAPHGYKADGIFHHYIRLMNDMGLGGWRTNKPLTEIIDHIDPISMAQRAKVSHLPHLYPTLGCYQGLLDAAQLILSPDYREEITIPLLCIHSSTDPISKAIHTHQFCDRLRCAAAITLRHASRLPFEHDTAHRHQFWSAFDAFIPGTGAPDPQRSLEDGVIL